jgi:murein DD-endopeptidase MepM/ murein hydrolase activator NlpD
MRRQIELAIPSPLTSEFYFLSIKNRINMLTKKRTSVYGLSMYIVVLPLIICLLMAFSPRKHFQIIKSDGNDSIQEQIALSLPIDKKNFLMESGYGERLHPVLGVMRLHTGIDLVAKEGVPVVSTQDGVVIKAQLADAWGNIIVIQHDGAYSTSYSHLKSMNVKEGDKVQKGQEIGLVGHTGLSTKDHLHFELHQNGKAIDPIKYLPEIK